jgi:serine/threonine protein kinase
MNENRPELFPVREVGNYRLCERLAIGTLSETYRAELRSWCIKPWALLKLLTVEIANEATFSRRLIDRFKVFNQLNISSLVPINNVGKIAGQIFLETSFFKGITLAQLMRRFASNTEPLPLPLCFHLAQGLAKTLVALHQHQEAHGAISSTNMMISTEGDIALTDACSATIHLSGYLSIEGYTPTPAMDMQATLEVLRTLFAVDAAEGTRMLRRDLPPALFDLLTDKDRRASGAEELLEVLHEVSSQNSGASFRDDLSAWLEGQGWLTTLSDDGCSPTDWADAASNLTRLLPQAHQTLTFLFGSNAAETIKLATQRRIAMLEATYPEHHLELYRLLLDLVSLDAKSAYETMQRLVQHCLSLWASGSPSDHLDDCIATYTMRLAEGGDEAILGQYASWVREYLRVSRKPHIIEPGLKPLWRFHSQASMVELARWIFDTPAYFALPHLVLWQGEGLNVLTHLAPLHEFLRRMLDDEQCAGSITPRSTGSGFTLTLTGIATCGLEAPEQIQEPPAAPIRFSDYYAWKLSYNLQDAGAPRFELYWPSEDRDMALIRMRAWLESQGASHNE